MTVQQHQKLAHSHRTSPVEAITEGTRRHAPFQLLQTTQLSKEAPPPRQWSRPRHSVMLYRRCQFHYVFSFVSVGFLSHDLPYSCKGRVDQRAKFYLLCSDFFQCLGFTFMKKRDFLHLLFYTFLIFYVLSSFIRTMHPPTKVFWQWEN